jgi:hypothetical protein
MGGFDGSLGMNGTSTSLSFPLEDIPELKKLEVVVSIGAKTGGAKVTTSLGGGGRSVWPAVRTSMFDKSSDTVPFLLSIVILPAPVRDVRDAMKRPLLSAPGWSGVSWLGSKTWFAAIMGIGSIYDS